MMMLTLLVLGILLLCPFSTEAAFIQKKEQAKVFPIFNVVQFDNSVCASTDAITGGGGGSASTRNGTCFTSKECEDKGGLVAGACASGFGVCCVFLRESGSFSENCTYVRNANFPGTLDAADAAGTTTYTVEKVTPGVCSIRLDFETFTLAGPATTGEENGGLCTDTFIATTTVGRPVPTICGENAGQHMYLDIGTGASNTATLIFTIDPAVTTVNRQWEVTVTQFHCGEAARAPDGCFQFHTGLAGRLQTFNFDSTSGHLQNQDYSICIRRERGFCCVRYSPCADAADPFTLDTSVGGIAGGFTDNDCGDDYVGIEASSGECSVGGTQLNSKYCGPFLNPNSNGAAGAMANAPVCDCTAPFMVDIHTDAAPDDGPPNTLFSKGVCLVWTQLPC